MSGRCASIVLGLLLIITGSFAQVKNLPGLQLPIKKAKGPIVLDGKLNEQGWVDAVPAKDFFQNYPVDTALATFQTEARLTFDDHALYISFVCHDNQDPYIVQSLRRDIEFDNNDNVGIYFGPYDDGINGFYFTITPYGVQSEGLLSAAGADDNSFNLTWDNKWFSKVVRSDDRWVAELMIPFKSFRFKHEASEWDMTFVRKDLKRNQTSSWIGVPIQYIPASFAYAGKLVWEEAPPRASNISLIPYIAGGSALDREAEPDIREDDLQAGFDAKIAVTPSLNLDLTVNPDFSQVEVDRQVVNLTRFEFQFPERRQFFLENSDLFDRMGFPEARPFFSRRIGLTRDTSQTIRKVPILYGARISGSISNKWRVGVLNMQTREKLDLGLPSQNFTVAAIQRNFWKQSNIQLSMTNKQSLGVAPGDSTKYFSEELWHQVVAGTDTSKVQNLYNRTATVDIETRSSDNAWYSSIYYSRSFDNANTSENQTGGGFISYTKRNYSFFTGRTSVGKNYNAETGFVPSKGVYPGITNTFFGGSGLIYPKKVVVNMGPQLDLNMSQIPSGTVTDKSMRLAYNINFINTAIFSISYSNIFSQLTNSFNPINGPTNSDKYTEFQAGEEFQWDNISLQFSSDQRKVFKYTLGITDGGFYNGKNTNFNGELNFRYQPYGSVSVRFDYNDVRLPGNYGQEKLFVVSPRIDLTLSTKLFLTTFVQYNKLIDNVNLNARLQWRYRPASDFFLVYTEDYLPSNMNSKYRSLVFKFTYWLNL